MKQLKIIIAFLLFSIGVSAQNVGEKISPDVVSAFEKTNPLFEVNIGDATLATRYKKGEGTPIVFVHGSWGDHNGWLTIAAQLATEVSNPIILYDRRGHGASSPDTHQGSITEDMDDAITLMKVLGFEKANFVGHSYGANIVVKLVSEHPECVANILVYEPPMFGLLKGKTEYKNDLLSTKKAMLKAKCLLENGEIEAGTIQFVEKVAFGDGSWENVFNSTSRAIMLSNYKTWLDQTRDPERLNLDPSKLNDLTGNITILYGSETLPVYSDVVDELDKILSNKTIKVVNGAGHAGLVTNSLTIVNMITNNLINKKR